MGSALLPELIVRSIMALDDIADLIQYLFKMITYHMHLEKNELAKIFNIMTSSDIQWILVLSMVQRKIYSISKQK